MQQRLVAQLIWPLQWMVSEGTRRVLVVWVGLIVAVIILTVAGLVWSPIAGFATRAALGIAGVVALCLIALVAKCLAVRAADEQAEHPEKSREAEIALVGVVVAGAVAIFVVPGPSVLGTTMLGATLLLILATYSRGVDLGLLPGLALGAAWGFGIIIMFGLLLDPWLKPDHLSHSQQLSAVIVPATPLTPSPRITGTVNFPEPGWEDYPAPAATEPPNALRHRKIGRAHV